MLAVLLAVVTLFISNFQIMNSIAKYFDKNSKKRELSDESKTSEEPKKHREDNEISYIENPDVFSEGMESEDCKSILYKCLKNLDKKVNFNTN